MTDEFSLDPKAAVGAIVSALQNGVEGRLADPWSFVFIYRGDDGIARVTVSGLFVRNYRAIRAEAKRVGLPPKTTLGFQDCRSVPSLTVK